MGKIKKSNFLSHIRPLSNNRGSKGIGKNSKSKRVSTSDLLIPKRHLKSLQRKILKFGSLKKFLHFLLLTNRSKFRSLCIIPKNEKTLYQSINQDLVRFSFRPDSADWAELRVLARYYGLSICNLFVILLEIGEEGSSSSGSPPFLSYKAKSLEGKGNEMALIQRILPGRRYISFSLFLRGSLSRKFASDS
ncbi:DUF1564 family protein [Leptospira stimsonii]|uniref:DUF1564 family protein n=1 Tax=Leptospira stimsonii TaxID=2202203 RepID=A0ABY2MZV5_9LEPT|nr:DUF1564 family protein [Leptospira stimsonii]TGK19111.1 DUF1564 family protein [Leptospira stimsonii]TGM13069.1 DUF1564 family protein [Leptospira stimsonii]